MKTMKLLTTLAIASVGLIVGCQNDDFQEVIGVCPVVVSTVPANGAINVPLNQIITATFNEEMNPATITDESFTIIQGSTSIVGTLKNGSTSIEGTISYSGRTVTFVPDNLLTPNTLYTGRIKTTVKDPMGNALQSDYVWSFTTDIPPTVIRTSPLDEATGVPLNKIVTATFSELMDSLTLKSPLSTFTIKQGTIPVLGAVSYSDSTAYFTPLVPFTPNTTYTATITTVAENELGTPMDESYMWTFTTSAQIILLSNPVNGGTTTGAGIYAQGTVVTVTAAPALGYAFVSWTEGIIVVSPDASYQFTMSDDRTLVANFSMNSYPLNVTAPNGTFTRTPNLALYNYGTVVQLDATANVGYTFVNWTEGATVLSTVSSFQVTMTAPRTLVANFSLNSYPLNVTAPNGSFTRTPNLTTYNHGTVVQLTAAANVGYTFVNWTEGTTVLSTVANFGVTMNAPRTLVANFSANAYTLTVTSANGVVTKSPNQTTYSHGTSVQLTAAAAPGYTFSSWSVDLVSTSNPATIVMNSNKNVTANYTMNPPVGPGIVDLKTAGTFAAVTKSGISTTGVTHITGDIGVSPVAASYITGFGLAMHSSNQYSTTPIVTGKVYAADYSAPTPDKLTTAVGDMETAYNTAMLLVTPAPVVNLDGGILSGQTLAPGLYKWTTGVGITTGITLAGGPNDTWVFQIEQDLTVNNSAIIHLSGGAQVKNITWVVKGQALLGTAVNFSGIILSKTLISLQSGTVVYGRLFAQTAVTIIGSTIIQPE